jgi:beta-1,4-mannooligosaccharide/beta-1,4-mannosyl-N-acetylglucosamine phosphorylase
MKIYCEELLFMPWEERPEGFEGVLWRYSKNPITKRNPIKKGARVFNSAVLPYDGKFVGVFRVDHKNTKPFLHVGWSEDGIDWKIDEEPIQWRDLNGRDFPVTYAYDPRLVKIEDTYYITFCTDDHGPTIGVGMTKDFRNFTRLPNAFVPCNRNGVLFPRKIKGKYVMLNRPSDMGHTPFGDIFLSESFDMVHWGNHRWVMGRSSNNWWENLKIGAGPVPIETSEGWLLIYHGVTLTCNGYVYSFGAALLDLEDPSKVLYRSRYYLMTPEEEYEVCGFVPNVVFPCATLCDGKTGRLAVYYGAADTYVALAFGYVQEIVEFVKENSD